MSRSTRRKQAAPPGGSPRAHGATLVMSAAALLWIAQAALLAYAVQRLANGAGVLAMLVPAAAYLALGVLRASSEAWGARRLFGA